MENDSKTSHFWGIKGAFIKYTKMMSIRMFDSRYCFYLFDFKFKSGFKQKLEFNPLCLILFYDIL